MNRKNISIFSGIVLVLVGWYFGIHQRFVSSSETKPMAGMKGMNMGEMSGMEGMEMNEMAGMDMGHKSNTSGLAQTAVMLSPARRQLIGVKTEAVKEQEAGPTIRTVGVVEYDERRVRQVSLRVSGWIADLYADYTGKPVKKGDPLFTLYSPDFVSTQKEYLLAKEGWERAQAGSVTSLRTGALSQVTAARDRLRLWNLTEEQIAQLDQTRKSQQEMTISSPISGVVTKKMALQGMFVTPEMRLYEITDLSVIWLYANIYEYELSQVAIGQEATVALAAYSGETFNGKVVYIDPYLSNETRTVRVRMELPNPNGKLKPGMYGNVEMKIKGGKRVVIPQEALLDSGTRKIVFVDQGGGMYAPREVIVGHKAGQLYPVLAGLTRGEKVVTSGTFLIDSESRLMAATNMMGMLGMGGIQMEQAQMGEMEMGGMPMGDMKGMDGMKMDHTASPREQTVEGLTVTLAIDPDPPKRGSSQLRLRVHANGVPVRDANVTVVNSMDMPGMEAKTVEAKPTKDGRYEATVVFTMKGAWEIDATVVRGKTKPVTAHFIVPIEK